MKKKSVLKNWVQTFLEGVVAFNIMFIVCTADSEWSVGYFTIIGILIAITFVNTIIINKYGRER